MNEHTRAPPPQFNALSRKYAETAFQIAVYRCGGHLGWSSLFYFRALKPGVDGYRFAVYGDMGNVNPQSLSRIQDEAQRGHFDMILHNGKTRTSVVMQLSV